MRVTVYLKLTGAKADERIVQVDNVVSTTMGETYLHIRNQVGTKWAIPHDSINVIETVD